MMTYKKMQHLYEKIKKNQNFLEENFTHTAMIIDTLESLFKYTATQENVDLYMDIMGNMIQQIQILLEDVK